MWLLCIVAIRIAALCTRIACSLLTLGIDGFALIVALPLFTVTSLVPVPVGPGVESVMAGWIGLDSQTSMTPLETYVHCDNERQECGR